MTMSTSAEPLGGASSGGTVADRSRTVDAPSHFAEHALARDKRESLDLAVKARWIALVIIALLLPFINPSLEVIYYEILLCGFALIGWAQRRIGRLGRSRSELLLMFCDLALLTVISIAPNPLSTVDWPIPMQYRFDNFIYFFVLLAGATLAYSWRTVVAMGVPRCPQISCWRRQRTSVRAWPANRTQWNRSMVTRAVVWSCTARLKPE